MFTRNFVRNSWRNLWAGLSLLAAISFVAVSMLQAQSTSSLRGVITDAQGAVVPGAVVALSSAATGASRQVVTDNTGTYQFLQEMPGEFTLSVTKPGFAKATQDHVVLQINTPATLNIQLEVGTTGQTVNVTAEASTSQHLRRIGGQCLYRAFDPAAAARHAQRGGTAEPATGRHVPGRSDGITPRSKQHRPRRRGCER